MTGTVVVDTSAVVAVLNGEPQADAIIGVLSDVDRRVMSAATLVELGIVMEARAGAAGALAVERFLREGNVTIVPLDRTHADRALEGWRRFGKGRHRAALNLGDCFTYGLATEMSAPVVCTGRDFAATDVVVMPEA